MTEQPDTAAIRAEIDEAIEIAPWTIAWFQMTARDLCDALDAARAELAEVREERNWLSRGDLNNTMSAYRAHREVDDAVKAHLKVTIARAEAAEAERDEEARNHLDDLRLLQAAEARIAGVERLRDAWNTSIPTMHLAESLNRALTGRTE